MPPADSSPRSVSGISSSERTCSDGNGATIARTRRRVHQIHPADGPRERRDDLPHRLDELLEPLVPVDPEEERLDAIRARRKRERGGGHVAKSALREQALEAIARIPHLNAFPAPGAPSRPKGDAYSVPSGSTAFRLVSAPK